jgi:hypothetical protein
MTNDEIAVPAIRHSGTSDNSPKPGICCRPTLRVGEILNKTAASQKRPTTSAIGNGVTGGTHSSFHHRRHVPVLFRLKTPEDAL